MKQKTIALFLTTLLVISGCGSSSTSTSQPSTEQSVAVPTESESNTDQTSSNIEAVGDIEVDEKLLTVEITVPAEFAGDTTQEELDESVDEYGYKSAKLNDDGSVTYVMSKAKHRELMAEMTENINSQLADMTTSGDYPNFIEITANDDFTEFTVITSSTEVDMAESMSVLALYMYGGLYNVFNGTSVDNVHVDFVNNDTGEIIQSADSADSGNASDNTSAEY